MKTILVTGGAGFVGSHVVDALIARGDRVICVDNFNDYYDAAIKRDNIAAHEKSEHFVLYDLDFCQRDALEEVFRSHMIDVIVHLGARAGVRASVADPQLYYTTNVMGTLTFLELAREYGVSHVVFASSSSVYGDRKDGPFKETDNVDTPISPYAATKKACEELGHVYYHVHGISFTALRFFTVYGPRGRPDMAPYIFAKSILDGVSLPLFGDGKQERDFTYVADIVKGVVSAIDKPLGYEIINLGNMQPRKVIELIHSLEHASGKKAKIEYLAVQPGDVGLTYADCTKAKQLLGYEPSTPLDEGAARLVSWLRQKNIK